MSTSKPSGKFIYTLPQGGSGMGYSHYEKYYTCPKMATLDLEGAKMGIRSEADSVREVQIGVLCHAFLDAYHTGAIEKESDLVFDTSSPHPSYAEPEWEERARDIMRQYIDLYPANSLGEIVVAERQIPDPEDPEEEKLVSSFYGKVPVTAKPDLLTLITEENQDSIEEARGIRPEAGYYLVDHKTCGSISGFLLDKYRYSIQFMHYIKMWELVEPNYPIEGIIVNLISRNKKFDSHTLILPTIDMMDESVVANFFNIAHDIKTHAPGVANPQACFKFNRICKYLENGMCKRY